MGKCRSNKVSGREIQNFYHCQIMDEHAKVIKNDRLNKYDIA